MSLSFPLHISILQQKMNKAAAKNKVIWGIEAVIEMQDVIILASHQGEGTT